ncbi:hypothetical protein FS842_000280, partial [Serendipita sp. 407]
MCSNSQKEPTPCKPLSKFQFLATVATQTATVATTADANPGNATASSDPQVCYAT